MLIKEILYFCRLSGKTHEVYTGVTLFWNPGPDGPAKIDKFSQVTQVHMAALSADIISAYIKTGEPLWVPLYCFLFLSSNVFTFTKFTFMTVEKVNVWHPYLIFKAFSMDYSGRLSDPIKRIESFFNVIVRNVLQLSFLWSLSLLALIISECWNCHEHALSIAFSLSRSPPGLSIYISVLTHLSDCLLCERVSQEDPRLSYPHTLTWNFLIVLSFDYRYILCVLFSARKSNIRLTHSPWNLLNSHVLIPRLPALKWTHFFLLPKPEHNAHRKLFHSCSIEG